MRCMGRNRGASTANRCVGNQKREGGWVVGGAGGCGRVAKRDADVHVVQPLCFFRLFFHCFFSPLYLRVQCAEGSWSEGSCGGGRDQCPCLC